MNPTEFSYNYFLMNELKKKLQAIYGILDPEVQVL